MTRQLVVEVEAVTVALRVEADFVQAARELKPAHACGGFGGFQSPLTVDRLQRVTPEDVLDVGDQQLLVLLLVVDAQRHDFA